MTKQDENYLSSNENCVKSLGVITQRLGNIKKIWSEATRDYYVLKQQIALIRADMFQDEEFRNSLKLYGAKEERTDAVDLKIEEGEPGLVIKFGQAKADMEAYDREFQVLDVQRSNIQSAMKVNQRNN